MAYKLFTVFCTVGIVISAGNPYIPIVDGDTVRHQIHKVTSHIGTGHRPAQRMAAAPPIEA